MLRLISSSRKASYLNTCKEGYWQNSISSHDPNDASTQRISWLYNRILFRDTAQFGTCLFCVRFSNSFAQIVSENNPCLRKSSYYCATFVLLFDQAISIIRHLHRWDRTTTMAMQSRQEVIQSRQSRRCLIGQLPSVNNWGVLSGDVFCVSRLVQA